MAGDERAHWVPRGSPGVGSVGEVIGSGKVREILGDFCPEIVLDAINDGEYVLLEYDVFGTWEYLEASNILRENNVLLIIPVYTDKIHIGLLEKLVRKHNGYVLRDGGKYYVLFNK